MSLDYLVAVVGSRGLVEERIAATAELLTENGFSILAEETLELSAAQAELLLGQTEGGIDTFLAGPCVAFLLQRENAYEVFNSLRLELDYTYGSLSGWLALRDRCALFPTDGVLERCVLLLKPGFETNSGGNVYAAIMQLLDEHDFVVLGKQMKMLAADTAAHVAGLDAAAVSEAAQAELAYLSSDMSLVLAVEKVDAIKELQLLLGPADPAEAKQHAPHTLRARLADPHAAPYQNLVYASSSAAQAASDLSLFFPQSFPLERTVLLLKPELVASQSPLALLDLLATQGFTVASRAEVYISALRAESYLSPLKSDPEYGAMTKALSAGPSLALLLTKPGALSHLQKLLGPADPAVARQAKPHSLRAKLGTDRVRNALHCSDSAEQSAKDVDEFFPNLPLERIPALDDLQAMLSARPVQPSRANSGAPQRSVQEVLIDALTQLCRVKPTGDDALLYLADWLLDNNPNKPRVQQPDDKPQHATLADELHAASDATAAEPPEPLTVSWLLGAPGTHAAALAARAVKELLAAGVSVELVDATQLLAQAEKTSSEHGALIAEYTQSNRIVPAHVLTPLLRSALANASARKLVVCAFPYSLDQAFEFERAVGAAAVKQLLYLEVQPADAAKVGISANMPPEQYQRRRALFSEEVLPVVEQYDLFHKVKRINAGVEEEEEQLRQIKQFITNANQ